MRKRIEPRPRPPDGPNDIAGWEGGMYPYDGTYTYADLHYAMKLCVAHTTNKYPLRGDNGPPKRARSDKLWRRK